MWRLGLSLRRLLSGSSLSNPPAWRGNAMPLALGATALRCLARAKSAGVPGWRETCWRCAAAGAAWRSVGCSTASPGCWRCGGGREKAPSACGLSREVGLAAAAAGLGAGMPSSWKPEAVLELGPAGPCWALLLAPPPPRMPAKLGMERPVAGLWAAAGLGAAACLGGGVGLGAARGLDPLSMGAGDAGLAAGAGSLGTAREGACWVLTACAAGAGRLAGLVAGMAAGGWVSTACACAWQAGAAAPSSSQPGPCPSLSSCCCAGSAAASVSGSAAGSTAAAVTPSATAS